jgi:hypothetical protein
MVTYFVLEKFLKIEFCEFSFEGIFQYRISDKTEANNYFQSNESYI